MSIKVNNITKLYGEQKALDNVSFDIKSGEIVGLLGPNGAGKSTMMKIITCFLPPTEGGVSVCGFDIYEQSMDVRKRVGYLPENNPLYHDMYVKEYLEFLSGIYKLGKAGKTRIKEMIQVTGLGVEQHKKIGALSKGYRQRVGLAHAMIHNPEVLILDEPTSGLDPNQLIEIRELIKTIGKEKTVMLSTHIMQEVEAVCNRVIIIDNGKIVADESTQNLQRSSLGKDVITVEFSTHVEEKILRQIQGVSDVKKIKSNTWAIYASSKRDIRPDIFQFAVDHKLTVLSLNRNDQSLEQVFQKLTKK